MRKVWKFTGVVRCEGSGCNDFPSCAGDLNEALSWGCEIEFEGEVIEQKKDHPIKRQLPVG